MYDENDTNQWYEKWLEINPGKTKADWKNYVLNKLAITTNYFLQLKIAKKANANYSAPETSPVVIGESTKQCTYDGECVCKKYNLIWGAKVDCAFRRKVVDICKILWGEDRKIEMANGLMAVMAVETFESFKAHRIMGIPLRANAADVVAKDFDQWVEQQDKNGNIIRDSKGNPVLKRSSRAVGLIQFTQAVFEDLKLFTKGSGFDALHRVKLKFAQKGEIAQLDDVKNYLEKKKDKMLKPEDIYIYVFAPDRIDRRNPNDILYDSKIDGDKYGQNKSIDTKDGNNDGKIQRKELLARYYKQYKVGEKFLFTGKFDCVEKKEKPIKSTNVKWYNPVDNPRCTLHTQNGTGEDAGKRWGLFGSVRNGSNHAGLDFFAKPGTNIVACVDGTVYNRRWHGGYGNTITIKVKDTKAFFEREIDYKLKYPTLGEINVGEKFTRDGNIYLLYAHLESVVDFKYGDEVKAGEILGKTGVSGVTAGTRAPHLHFEILSEYQFLVGTNYRIHPARFIQYKSYDEQSADEKDEQKELSIEPNIKKVNGDKKLLAQNIF